MIRHLTLYTHNILINSLCKLNRIDVGLSVLCGLFNRGFEPEVVTFTTLIKGFYNFCFTDKIRLAVVLFVNMSKKGYPVNVVTYGLIDGLCKVGDTGTALRLLRRMEESGLRPDLGIQRDDRRTRRARSGVQRASLEWMAIRGSQSRTWSLVLRILFGFIEMEVGG
ncbi:hypothetical protein QJS10_CPA02g00917 [Acorus calamus]|uniref:Pentatricopeptide repeat protein n=1 Tax=Acorus calamus TaxID=4465 RepID=A0AAV9FEF7_ACOCL|nr:hypothetical protein QJS10_CPA02g00917 [Acorus calamus]